MTPIILNYLKKMASLGASDLYITERSRPILRVDNKFIDADDVVLTRESIDQILSDILTTKQFREFETTMELNTSLDLGEMGRFRVNVMKQRQVPALVIRRIITTIPSFSELRLPDVLERLSVLPRGLILVTGMTGSGKTTSLASMVDYRNKKNAGHIITIEDPIEYFHEHQKSIVTQREVGVDTESYSVALKNALRQRPDVILVGEIRDRDVMEQALVAAETGHLCLATLHTNNAYQAIERIINFFPEEMGGQVRLSLSNNLQGILSQRLLPSIKGRMTLALEVMLNQGLIKELIHKGDIKKIREVMEQNIINGMQTFDQSLLQLFMDGMITKEVALAQADVPNDLRLSIQKFEMGGASNKSLSGVDTSLLSISE